MIVLKYKMKYYVTLQTVQYVVVILKSNRLALYLKVNIYLIKDRQQKDGELTIRKSRCSLLLFDIKNDRCNSCLKVRNVIRCRLRREHEIKSDIDILGSKTRNSFRLHQRKI